MERRSAITALAAFGEEGALMALCRDDAPHASHALDALKQLRRMAD